MLFNYGLKATCVVNYFHSDVHFSLCILLKSVSQSSCATEPSENVVYLQTAGSTAVTSNKFWGDAHGTARETILWETMPLRIL